MMIMIIMGTHVGLFIYYVGLFIYHGYDTKYILGRKTSDLCVGCESGITGLLMNFPFQRCTVCKDHAFLG